MNDTSVATIPSSVARLAGPGASRSVAPTALPKTPASRRPLLAATAALVCTVLICGWFWVVLGKAQAEERRQWQGDRRIAARLSVEAVAQRAGALFHNIDLALAHLAHGYLQHGGGFSEFVSEAARSFPPNLVADMMILNAQGVAIQHSNGSLPGDSAADREHFLAHGDAPPGSARIHVGRPLLLGPVSEPVIPFSRGLWRNNVLVGVVVMLVRVNKLGSVLGPDAGGDGDRLELARADGWVLSRNFDLLEFQGGFSMPRLKDVALMTAPSGELLEERAEGIPTTEERGVYWRRLQEYPVIAVARPDNRRLHEALMSAQRDVRQEALGLFGAACLVVFLGTYLLTLLRAQRQRIVVSEQLYRAAFDSDPSIKLLVDPATGILVNANPAAERYYGYPRTRLIGSNPGPLLSSDHTLRPGAPGVAAQHRLSSGEIRDVEAFATAVQDGGRALALVTIQDVTDRQHLEAELRHRQAVQGAMLEVSQRGMLTTDTDGRVTFVSAEAERLLGCTGALAVGQLRLLDILEPEDLQSRFAFVADSTRPAAAQHSDFLTAIHRLPPVSEGWRLRRADGSPVASFVLLTRLRDGDGTDRGCLLWLDDAQRMGLAAERQRLAEAAFESSECKMITTVDGRIQRVNQAFCDSMGLAAADMVGQTPQFLRSGRHDAVFYEGMWRDLQRHGRWEGEIWNRRRDGRIRPEWLLVSAIRDERGETTHYVASYTDLSGKLEADQQIVELASYDPLTKLPNRHLLHTRLQEFIERVSVDVTHSLRGALLFIDMDNFKLLNDTMGHHVGDLMLIEVSRRLESILRSNDVVARLGGDEFVVLLQDLGSDTQEAEHRARAVCEKILLLLGQPYKLSGIEHHTSASVGVTMIGDSPASTDDLLRRADVAMYQAKGNGKNELCFYNPAMQKALDVRSTLERELREAIDGEQFILHYQPQVNDCGELAGAEALLRWQHPERGLIPPAGLIPVAEETGLIVPIGREVLRMACRQIAQWRPYWPDRFTLAVNVSVAQFRHHQFVEQVQEALTEFNVEPERLKLELTESILVHDIDVIAARMGTLRDIGVGFSLDDFGTGYSSLSYLKKLPLDQIKIDRSFVRDILVDANDTAIARAIIALGRSLSLAVVAEGVETEAQWNFLRDEGCDQAQGFLFAQPMGSELFAQRMHTAAALLAQAKGGSAGDLVRWQGIDLSRARMTNS